MSEYVLWSGVPTEFFQGQEFLCSSYLKVPIEVNDLENALVLCCDTGSMCRSYHMLNFKVMNLAVYVRYRRYLIILLTAITDGPWAVGCRELVSFFFPICYLLLLECVKF